MPASTFRDKFELENKTAIVTGGAGILGRRFCRGLAEFGANVAVVDLSEDAAREVAQEIARETGANCLGIGCDVSQPDSVAAMTARVVENFGEIHILHNNAASKSQNLEAFFKSFEEYSLEEWRNVTKVNLDGMFLVAQSVGKQMVQQGKGGSIIQTASIYGIRAPDHRIYEGSFYLGMQISLPAVYSATKAAVVGLSQYLATYWAPHNIRVNTLTPGGVESGQNEIFQQKYGGRVPLGRMAQRDEMVGALLFLAGDASTYITGQNIVVDGGLSAW